jgi:hypothetical protein
MSDKPTTESKNSPVDEPYAAPQIADRTPVDGPLVAFGSGPPAD